MGGPAAQESSSASNPGMQPAARAWIGPAATRLTRMPARPRSRARWRLSDSNRPCRRHPVVDGPGGDGVEVEAHDAGPGWRGQPGDDAGDRGEGHGAGLEGHTDPLPSGVEQRTGQGVDGCEAMAWRAPSRCPHRSEIVSVSRAVSSASVASQATTSMPPGNCSAASPVRSRSRGKPASRTWAPNLRARRATAKAMLSVVTTPVTSICLPFNTLRLRCVGRCR